MKMKCIGAHISEGEYQGYPYRNVILHFEREAGDKVVSWGTLTSNEKVRMEVLDELQLEPKDLVGFDVELFYNRYQRVSSLKIS